MKEIKFRVWDNHYNRWEERPCAINKEGILFIYNVDSGEWFEPSHTGYTVEWYTGLKDKNGKDLDWWEGDIFARSSDRQIEGVIIYDLGCFWLDRTRDERILLYECVDWSMSIYGNIHQNPELLEKPK